MLNLLQDLQQQFAVTYLLISHDIAVVDHLCDEVAVLYAGRIVEQGSPEVLFKAAAHPYTRALMASVPDVRAPRRGREPTARAQSADAGTETEAGTPRTGCSFAARCPDRQQRCDREVPALRAVAEGHLAACHFAAAVMIRPSGPGCNDDRQGGR